MLLRNAPFAPQAGRHYAAHVHFAPTPEEGIVYHGQLCQSFLCLGSAAPWGCSLAERHRLIGSVCHDFTSDNDSDTHHQYEIKSFFLWTHRSQTFNFAAGEAVLTHSQN